MVAIIELCRWLLLWSCVGGYCYRFVWVFTVIELVVWVFTVMELCGWFLLQSCVGGYCYGVVWVVTVMELCGWLL